ncbi:MAG: B12-binding domain-containing radical SAM protein [Cytophagaceae bacterium]|jgi:radical SAM superfamily enzyme YgiQ (UPF0313 family)|nr:B12-binding domain-containing radical SAM protein [Cytophagaceae bacterium]
MKQTSVLLFNPRATNYNPRIPNSILQVAASIDGQYKWYAVDGNLESDPWSKIEHYLSQGDVRYVGFTVMPGPQLKQAIPYAKKIREQFPGVVMIWGGYFASNQYQVCLNSGWVDFIINGPGDYSFPALLQVLENGGSPEAIRNLIFKKGETIVKTAKADLADMDVLPPLPYEKWNTFYPLSRVLAKTFLGNKTIAYHSSFGCPFTCSFCAVVPIYEARWKGRSADGIFKDVEMLHREFGGNALEFHDNNFFVSEKRAVAFARLIRPLQMRWWGEARIDTMHKYSDESLRLLRESGCVMIFFGAETGNDDVLKAMDKGGTQTADQILSFAERLKRFDIIPEYSFVLGLPAKTEKEVWTQINADIRFIKKIKSLNASTEIILYLYSPVPVEGSELFEQVKAAGFKFPQLLEDWISPAWERFDLRKNPLTPWLQPYMVDQIKNFETVLNAYYPSSSDIRLKPWMKKVLRMVSYWRYHTGIYQYPWELKLLLKVWKYRQPEKEGF